MTNMKKNNKKSTKKPIKNKVKSAVKPKIQPLGSRVLIKPFTKEELSPKNSFGIILPDSSKEKSEQGTVVAVGPGEWKDGRFISPSVRVGDKIAFSKYGFDDININGEELYLIKEENILAILN